MPRHKDAPSVGRAIQRARHAAGLTQQVVARESGLSKGELSQIERETRLDPRFSTVAILSQILGLSLDQLAFECGLRAGHRLVRQDLSEPDQFLAEERLIQAITKAEASLKDLREAKTLVSAQVRRAKRKR